MQHARQSSTPCKSTATRTVISHWFWQKGKKHIEPFDDLAVSVLCTPAPSGGQIYSIIAIDIAALSSLCFQIMTVLLSLHFWYPWILFKCISRYVVWFFKKGKRFLKCYIWLIDKQNMIGIWKDPTWVTCLDTLSLENLKQPKKNYRRERKFTAGDYLADSMNPWI